MPDNALSRIDLNILKNLKQDGRAELCGVGTASGADHNTLQRARKTLGKRRLYLLAITPSSTPRNSVKVWWYLYRLRCSARQVMLLKTSPTQYVRYLKLKSVI